MKKETKLEMEAKAFQELTKPKPARQVNNLNVRRYFAGQAMAALIIKSHGGVRKADIKREAYEWADYMLED
jgi:hypothetical protein